MKARGTFQQLALAVACIAFGSATLAEFGAEFGAEFEPEAIGNIDTLPERYPDHWVLVADMAFTHMLEGKVLVVDPLADSIGGQFKGMMTASFVADFARASGRNEHYVAESFYSRGGRGGTRTDVLAIYDPQTLTVAAEIEIPAKRITGVPKASMISLIGGERFLGVYNFTPAQSVSIVDLEKRVFVGEVATPGCGFVLANGERSFTSICANGSMLTSHLDAAGKLASTSKTPVLFDAENDPIFETSAQTGGVAYYPTFQGNILPVDVSTDEVSARPVWSLTQDDEKNWRPGGVRPLITDASGVGYVLMHPHGGEGTHKDGGSEVWSYDLAKGKRLKRVELSNYGLSLSTSGTAKNRLLHVTTATMGIDVYRLPEMTFVHTLAIGVMTPFLMHSAE